MRRMFSEKQIEKMIEEKSTRLYKFTYVIGDEDYIIVYIGNKELNLSEDNYMSAGDFFIFGRESADLSAPIQTLFYDKTNNELVIYVFGDEDGVSASMSQFTMSKEVY